MIPARTHTAAYMQTLYTGEMNHEMTPAHKKGEHMTAIDLTSYVEDYETAETRAHKHALTSLTFGLNFAPLSSSSRLNHRSARYLSLPSIRSAFSKTRREAQSASNGIAAQNANGPIPFGKARGGRAAPFPHVNQLPLSRRLAAISNTLPLSLAPIAIICTTSMRLPRIR